MTPPYFRPHRPHDCRRAPFHDYKAPGTYMISISKDPGCPQFSQIAGDVKDPANPPATILSSIGSIIEYQIHRIEDWTFFRIHKYVIMPDHIHLLLQVTSRLDHDLGHYIGLFKSRCTTNFRRSLNTADTLPAVFCNKYNDKIAFDAQMADRFSNYIADNPRRRLIAIQYPHLFRRVQSIEINDMELDFYGNFQLLKYPIITPVIVSSRYTSAERAEWERKWEETIRSRGVLVSPFISEAEQNIMVKAIEEGASIIRIIPDGLPPRYKPHGKEFDLSLQGRCLHVGPPRPSRRAHTLTRQECMHYNDLARWISTHSTHLMTLLNTRR